MAKKKEPEAQPFDLSKLRSTVNDAALATEAKVKTKVLHYPEPLSWLSSGITLFDAMVHRTARGLPSGRPIHLYGPPSSGKTLIGYMIGKAAQDRGGLFIKVDSEYFSPDLADVVGLDYSGATGNFLYYRPLTLELLMDMLEAVYVSGITSPVPIVVLCDGIAGNDAMSNQDTTMDGGTYQQGKPPQLWSRFFKRMAIKRAAYSNVYMLFTNQVRLKLDFFSRGPVQQTPLGGFGVAHSMHLEVGCSMGPMYYPGSGETSRSRADDKTVVGQWVQAKATKNRMGPSHRPIGFPIYYNWGVDDTLANLDFLKEHAKDVFVPNGSRYAMEGGNHFFWQWHHNALRDQDLATRIRDLTLEKYKALYHTWGEERR